MRPSFVKLCRRVFALNGIAKWCTLGLSLSLAFFVCAGNAQTKAAGQSSCEIRAVHFEGWQAQEISNAWVTLSIVPQLGGRVMQVTFAGHPYLFVNPQLKGKYYPPSDVGSKGHWFNYGGDKLWPLPEGTEDEQHWPGPVSDELDDGSYQFTVLSNNPTCTVRLEGPPDPKTGLQYTREISISNDSPKISFRAIMKNASGHAIRWSVQSVSQYDTSDAQEPAGFHRDFWAFTPSNERSAYFGGFHVRSGLADDPSFAIRDGLFRLHWMFRAAGWRWLMEKLTMRWWSAFITRQTRSTREKPRLFSTRTGLRWRWTRRGSLLFPLPSLKINCTTWKRN
jgi:hypothetical protein